MSEDILSNGVVNRNLIVHIRRTCREAVRGVVQLDILCRRNGLIKFVRCAQELREIACAHSARRHGDDAGSGRGLTKALIVHEEEQLVSEDGTAERAAEQVLVEDAFGNFVVVIAPEVCSAILVLVERVEAAMELVGSGLGDSEDFAAVHVAVFGIGVTCDHLHLANGLRSRVIGDGVLQRLVDVCTVEDVVVSLHAVAIEGWLRRRGKGRDTLCTLRAAQRTVGRQDRAGDEHSRCGEVLARKGHAFERIGRDGRGQRGILGLKDRTRLGRHLDSGTDLAHF